MSTTPEVDHTPISPDDVPIPALLRAARGGYTHAVRARLAAAGFEDLPRNGAYILGGIVNRGGTAGDLVRQLGVSKQAASQLIDTLVVRGYLDREVNPEDRRRVTVVVTERGRAAAAAVGAGVEAIDEELATLISPGELAALRGGLIALCDIRDRLEEAARAGADITGEY
ncbi:MAG: helix-turn-helix domain-containing protein [Solirubrobacteraceae bacterium]|jgi:DNA-binding MarR family transcriptional regulator